jgi:nitroreductase
VDAFEAIQRRHSVRAYLPDPISKEKLGKILEAARLAPSASNLQPWHFIVVTDAQKRKDIAKGGIFAHFLSESPVVIVGCGNRKASPRWHAIDTTIAMQNMVLAATAEGLGTCWVGSFAEETVKALLKIPEGFSVIALLSVGYPREKWDLIAIVAHLFRRRKQLDEIASAGEYGVPFGQSTGRSEPSVDAINHS